MDLTDLRRSIAELTPEKRALLERRLMTRSAPDSAPIPRREATTSCPLSFAQQRLWFLDQLEPHGAVYNIARAVQLRGPLHVEALRRTLDAIVARHEVLRTTYVSVDGAPVQAIADGRAVDMQVVDLTAWPEPERAAELQRRLEQEARCPFDLARDLMLRATLFRLAHTEHALSLTMHHIASDGWSMGVLFQEVAELYEAFTRETPSRLPPLPIQYADYALWQRRWLHGERLEAQVAYWRQRLAGATAVLDLPTDRPRPTIQTFRGARESLLLPGSLTEALTALSRRESVTLFMTLLAGFQTLLHRYTGQEDIVVGSPIAGRARGEVESLIGFFVNTLVLRTDLSGAPTFRALLGRVREAAVGAYGHQDVPFEQLVEELQPERSPNHPPLFQVMFVFQNVSTPTLSLPGLTSTPLAVNTETAKFDLSLYVEQDTEHGLRTTLEYSTDLFDAATMRRMLGHWQTLLESVAADPERSISHLPLLSEPERHQLLVEWNETWAEDPRESCVHRLFEAQVERTPDAIAVVYGEQSLTYRELNDRANRVAHYLRERGVGPEVLVGLYVERSLLMMEGLLGILKAGGAYVPLDPAYPKSRLTFMLGDSRAPVLITQQHLAERLVPQHVVVVCLDLEQAAICEESEANPNSGIEPDNLAYVIYTSGSTGTPKGVMVAHRGLCNLAAAQGRVYDVSPDSRVLQFASLSFDVSIAEIMMALSAGATLDLGTRDAPLAGVDLIRLLRARAITVVALPPSVLATLPVEALPALGTIIVTGEACPFDVVTRWGHGRRLFNAYGPTETTVWATLAECHDDGRRPPIGRPISNTQTYVLDAHGEPVPIGVPGELHVGGVGLARGYLERPELTAEKFVANPFRAEPGARLYKTGDLVRYLPDGSLDFMGRSDHQVKIRGYRVELGEIEAVLGGHPAVGEAVVLARADVPGEPRLVAYVVPGQGQVPTSGELRSLLKDKLPHYMVPSAFVLLDRLPLTPNGKVDRRALPAPDSTRAEPADTFVAARDPLELQLTEVWETILGVRPVGVRDNFFDLGGHSLLGVRLFARIEKVLGKRLPLISLFRAPTVEQLASVLREDGGAVSPTAIPRRKGPAPCALSFAQQRLWFLNQLEPHSAVYNISSAVHLRGPLRVEALQQTLDAIVARHESLRTTCAVVDGTPMQVIADRRPVDMAVIDLTARAEPDRRAELQRLVGAEARRPFDLSRDLMLRAIVVRLAADEHALILTMHHIASDGWSMGVLFREVADLYEAFAHGNPSPLPPLAIQYADHAVWQRQWLQGERLEAELAYWRQRLAGAPDVLELPTDRPRPAVQTFRGARESLFLPGPLTKALTALSRQEGVTLFMTLLAGFQTLLHRYTGQEDIVVGSPIAGRTCADVEGLIGFFVNTLVLRTDLSGEPTFRALLARVRESALGAYGHQELPFEKLVEELQPERSASYSPLFQVMLVLQSSSTPALSLPGLASSPLAVDTGTAKFDLTLYVAEDTEQGLRATLEYNADLFDGATVSRMLGHWQTLLESVVARPDESVSHLPLLTEAEQQLLVAWNDTRAEYPREACLPELFEAQVARTPDAVAVVGDDERVTYRELNRRANQLAHRLRRLGVGPEVLVGICVERSVAMVVGLLGILKAGGAYVPLDPAYPIARLTFMQKDAGAEIILTQRRVQDALPLAAATVICLDTDWESIASEPAADPAVPLTADHLAYVIYTSGSTGHPKGVEIVHGGLLNLIHWHQSAFTVTVADRASQLVSPGFDAAGWELWPYLTAGASVHFADEETRLGSEALRDWLVDRAITIGFVPTPLAERLIALDWPPGTALRVLLTGADTLHRYPPPGLPFALANNYGPTEATVVATSGMIPAASAVDGAPSIGRPIANTQVYVVDSHLEPVPIGVRGELLIGGAGLARGYLRASELTAEKFIPHPFSPEPQARVYKTGDLVRYLPDGTIEFLGRTDRQVKIRGFRIELGEIETVLADHPAVRETVVLAREDAPGESRLVGYVVPRRGLAPTSGELRRFLSQTLPHHMVPSAFVILDRLPLTLNGKVDRRGLPAPEPTRPEAAATFVAPRDPLEVELTTIWETMLGVRPVGVRDNFFDLGGHSLLAVRLFARIEEILGKRLPLATLFRAPTVEQLASALREDGSVAPRWSSLVAIQPGGSKRPLVCVHPHLGGVLCYYDLARALGEDQPVYGLEAVGLDGIQTPRTRIEDMAAHYVKEVRELQPEGPYFLAGYCFGGVVAFEMAQQLRSQGQPVALLAVLDAAGPGRLTSLPARIRRLRQRINTLARLTPRERRLAVCEKAAGVGTRIAARVARLVRTERPMDRAMRKVEEAHIQAARAYLPRPYPGQVRLFLTGKRSPPYGGPVARWREVAIGGLTVCEVPGDQGEIVEEPRVRVFAEQLRACLEAARPAGTT